MEDLGKSSPPSFEFRSPSASPPHSRAFAMSKKRKRVDLLLILSLILIFRSLPSSAVDLLFNGFSTSDLGLFANATLEPFPISSSDSSRRRYLSLTADSSFSLGRALYPSPIPTKASDGVLDFYASFILSIATIPNTLPGHGIAFLFAPAPGTLGASSAQHLGLFNLSTDGDPGSRVLAVEFDLFQNQEFLDIDANHVGVDRNSLTSVASKPAGYWPDDEAGFVGLILNDGSNYQVWVDYVGGRLNVTMAPAARGRKPRRPLISTEIDLSDLFLDEMYVGFCGATGQLVERHRVLGWSFSNSNLSAGDGLITSGLPNFIPPASQSGNISRRRLVAGLSVTAVVLVISAATAAVLWIRIRRRTKRGKGGVVIEEVIEDWESEYWPHRIRYQEIAAATEAFSDSKLIGRGGNGRVYRGDLGGTHVAVKLFYQTDEEEAKQFAAEVSTLGRLKHRNLVGLRGWCRARRATAIGGEVMILVYDYMKNGSLDERIFGNGMPLNWKSRARILRDVAAAALYLHEGWGEAVVLHRDIKASNVMLDSEMTGRLGDFGLARAHERGRALGTTRVVGSAGYLAPEVVKTGRATTATDVYAFGVLVLEVVSGRRAAAEGQSPLVAWVREAAGEGGALVVDSRARASEGYDDWEAAMVVSVGLACTRDCAAARPSMRQVVRLLEAGEHDAAEGGEDSTSWLLDARLRPLMESDNECSFEGRLRQKQQRHLTFEELRQSLSCSTSLSGSDDTVEGR